MLPYPLLGMTKLLEGSSNSGTAIFSSPKHDVSSGLACPRQEIAKAKLWIIPPSPPAISRKV